MDHKVVKKTAEIPIEKDDDFDMVSDNDTDSDTKNETIKPTETSNIISTKNSASETNTITDTNCNKEDSLKSILHAEFASKISYSNEISLNLILKYLDNSS